MTVELEELVEESDIWLVHGLLEDHVRYTGSALGVRILDNWEHLTRSFVKVIPPEYKEALQARRTAKHPLATRPAPAPELEGGPA